MLSKNKIKLINSLTRKKNREQTGLFLAEGEKLITELIAARYIFHTLIATDSLIDNYPLLDCEKITVPYTDIKKVSSLKTPQPVIALVYQPQKSIDLSPDNELVIALDSIQDPGNLGTIIRLASWFGIRKIVCSNTTVDEYNPKVVQATMGAIAHVSIHYTNLEEYLQKATELKIPIYGTFLEGENIYKSDLSTDGIVVLGNEGNGISNEIEQFVSRKLFIPSFSEHAVESLNVSMATAIVCSEFKRLNA